MSKNWMLTHQRREVFPLDLKLDDIDILDIAQSLSRQCRYNGHIDAEHYSVAEHSYVISKALERDGYDRMTQLIGLHHDDSETWIQDIIKPLKNAMEEKGISLKPFELKIEELVSQKFELPWPWPAVIHLYDKRIVRDEKEQLKAGGNDWSEFEIPAVGLLRPGDKLHCWTANEAKYKWLDRHRELTSPWL